MKYSKLSLLILPRHAMTNASQSLWERASTRSGKGTRNLDFLEPVFWIALMSIGGGAPLFKVAMYWKIGVSNHRLSMYGGPHKENPSRQGCSFFWDK